jgi:transposase-like protein
MTPREIEEGLHEMYSVEIWPQFISRTTERLVTEITEWQNRPSTLRYTAMDCMFPCALATTLER